jgi:DNA-binding MarR family transcriptional regulator
MAFRFETSFGRALGAAHMAMFRYLTKLMRDAELPITPDQFRVLTHLWENDGLQQSELAVCTNRNRANVTRVIDILERKGIVERKDDPNDRRVHRIFLTEQGKSLRAPTARCALQSIEDSLKGISEDDIEICRKVLLKIRENVS